MNATAGKMVRTPSAAGYTGLSESTLNKLRLYGNGPRYVKLGRCVLYDIADLDEWISEHRRRSTSGK